MTTQASSARSETTIFAALWRFRALVAGITIGAAVLGYGLSFLQSEAYKAEARLILEDPRSSGVFRPASAGLTDPARYLRNQAEIMESATVLLEANERSGSGLTLQQLRQVVDAQPSRDLDLVRISAVRPTPEEAVALANAVGEVYGEVIEAEVRSNAEQSLSQLEDAAANLQARLDQIEEELLGPTVDIELTAIAWHDAVLTQLATLSTSIEQITVDAALYASGIQLLDEARAPQDPIRPAPLRNSAIAGLLGFIIAATYAWWRSDGDPIVADRHEPASVLGVPLLGDIPEFTSVGERSLVPAAAQVPSTASDAYQFVVASLAQVSADTPGTLVLQVTSAEHGSGKTITAANLAAAMQSAGSGGRVLLVDADERLRGLTRLAGLDDAAGLTDLVLRDDLDLEQCINTWELSDHLAVDVIPAGISPSDIVGFFRGGPFRKAIEHLRAKDYEMIIVDSPPVLGGAEAIHVGSDSDATVLVIEPGTRYQALEDAAQRLELANTRVVGYVFNRSQNEDWHRRGSRRSESPQPAIVRPDQQRS